MESKKQLIYSTIGKIFEKSELLKNHMVLNSLDSKVPELKKVDVFETQLFLIKLKAEIEVLDKCLDFEIERLNALGL